MARRTINIGTNPGPSSLDSIRSALSKAEQNFTEVYTNVDGLSTNLSNLTSSVTTTSNRLDQLSTTVSGLGNLNSKASLSGATFSGGVTFQAGLAIAGNSGLSLGQGGSLSDEQAAGVTRTRLSVAGDRFVLRNAANAISLLSVDTNALTFKTYTVWHSGNFTPDTTVTPSGATFTGPVQASSLTATGASPYLVLRRSAQSDTVADQSAWDVVTDATSLRHRTVSDAGIAGAEWLSVRRSGTSVTGISLAVRPSFGTATPWDTANFTPSAYLSLSGGTLTGSLTLRGTTGGLTATSGNLAALAVRSGGNTSDAAFVSFNRGSFGVYLGLDTDNEFKLGGWSLGNVARKIWHEGNLSVASLAPVASPSLTGRVTIVGATSMTPNAALAIQAQPGGTASLDLSRSSTADPDWRVTTDVTGETLSIARPGSSALALTTTGLLSLSGSTSGLALGNRDTTGGWTIASVAGVLALNNGADRIKFAASGDVSANSFVAANGADLAGHTNLRPKSGETVGDLRWYNASNILQWTIEGAQNGSLAIKRGSDGAVGLTLGSDLVARFSRPPVLTQAGVGQDGVSNIIAAGADPSGVADSTAAIQAALDALGGNGILWIPPGTYRVRQTLNFIGTGALKIAGVPGASLLRQESATLFSIQASTISLNGFGITCAVQAGTAFDLSATTAVVIARDLRGTVADDASWWDYFFKTNDLSNSQFDTINVSNSVSNVQLNASLMRGSFVNAVTGTGGSSRNRFANVSVRAFYYGFDLRANSTTMDQWSFTDCILSQMRIGLSYANTVAQGVRGVTWRGGSIEAFERCVQITNDAGTSINDATLVRDCSHALTGGHISATTVSGNAMISNNILSFTNSSAGKTIGAVPAIALSGCTGIVVSNNVGLLTSDVTAMTALTGGSTICNVVMNLMRGGTSGTVDGVLDQGSSNYSFGNRRV